MSKFVHKKSGKLYELVDGFSKDYTVKQSSGGEWENAVAYISCETYQPFITGLKRFTENFEEIPETEEDKIKESDRIIAELQRDIWKWSKDNGTILKEDEVGLFIQGWKVAKGYEVLTKEDG